MLSTALTTVLVLNALWFGAAFRMFSFKQRAAARLLVSQSDQASPIFPVLAASLRFLGGMNFAAALLAVALLANRSLFPNPQQWVLLLAVFAVAHASQFVFNVPHALATIKGIKPLWPVLKGQVAFIFVVDFALMVANAVLALVMIRQ